MASKDVIASAFEEDLINNPHSLANWRSYLDFLEDSLPAVRFEVFERALAVLPRSYKLWHQYLTERITDCRDLSILDPKFSETNAAFERSLIHMSKMPVIWKLYLDFLHRQKLVTKTRREYNRALCSLPVTQHIRWIWPGFLAFANECGVPETSLRIWKRYIKCDPSECEEYISALKRARQFDTAAVQLATIVNDDSFVSKRNRTKSDLWSDLIKLLVKQSDKITSIDTVSVLRSGIVKYPEQAARLWNAMAEYYTRTGLIEKARDIYEEGINTVKNVRDFTKIYEAYTKFCDAIITAKMMQLDELKETLNNLQPMSDDSATTTDTPSTGKKSKRKRKANAGADTLQDQRGSLLEQIDDADTDISLWVLRFEKLVQSRALLVNSVALRRNPNDVSEWLNRVKLYSHNSDSYNVLKTFVQAVETVDPFKAEGKMHSLWTHFASTYERAGQIQDARQVYEKALDSPFKAPESLSHIYCRYAEMELLSTHIRAGGKARSQAAIDILTRATTPPKKQVETVEGQVVPAKNLVYRSPLLWSFLVDLHESYGTVSSTKAVYDRMISLKIVTPTLLLNFASFLEENSLFEDAFRAYESGISTFSYPHSAPIWLSYVKKFVERYGGQRLDRTRDIFEQAVAAAPPQNVRVLYVMYSNFEELYGVPRAMLRILKRACIAVPIAERLDMFFLYAAKAAEYFGAVHAREAFDLAMKSLPEHQLPIIAIQYAVLERKLGDLDRARAIYLYGSQYADPTHNAKYWSAYKVFELAHGNDNTYRDMLKARRSVKLHFAQSSLHTNALVEKALEKQKLEAQRETDAKQSAIKLDAVPEKRSVDKIAPESQKSDVKKLRTNDDAESSTTTATTTNIVANPDEMEINFDE